MSHYHDNKLRKNLQQGCFGLYICLYMTNKSDLFNTKYFKRVNKHSNLQHYDKEGIYHDTNYVKNCLTRCNRLFNSTVEFLKCDFQFDENLKTLCYLSSGVKNVVERFSSFEGINNVILIDYQFPQYSCIRVSDNQTIYCIPSEVAVASQILQNAGVNSIDFLVDINSGLNLGFGFYSVSSHLSLSAYSALLNTEKFIFIGSKKYLKVNQQYSVSNRSYLNCFLYQSRKTIKQSEYVSHGLNFDLSLLTTYQHSCQEFDITLFENKKQSVSRIIQKGNLNIHCIQGNIFEADIQLDVILLYFRNLFQYQQFKTMNNHILDFRGTYFNVLNNQLYNMSLSEDILRLADKGVEKIGFVPLEGFDYVKLINNISSQKNRLTDLYFYYFDQKDLNTIYQIDKIME